MNDLNMVEWARELLYRQIKKHPLPWKVDQDWTWEVIAADGTCLAKFQTCSQAEEMVAAAEALQAYVIESTKKADEELKALGYEDLFAALDKEDITEPKPKAHNLMHPDGPKCACGKPSYHESGACYDCYYWK